MKRYQKTQPCSGRLGLRLLMEAPVDGLQQQRQVQWLGEVLVHPRLPAALDVIGKGIGCHGYDWNSGFVFI